MDALATLAPVSERYARLPVEHAFDWSDCSERMPAGSWYLVAFRSIRRPGTDEERLMAYDDRAHQEAAETHGFVHYFKGPSAPDGSCLSFCMWTSRAEARAAAGRMAHREAVAIVHEMYVDYRLEFVRVTKASPAAEIKFEPWDRTPEPAAASPTVQPGLSPA